MEKANRSTYLFAATLHLHSQEPQPQHCLGFAIRFHPHPRVKPAGCSPRSIQTDKPKGLVPHAQSLSLLRRPIHFMNMNCHSCPLEPAHHGRIVLWHYGTPGTPCVRFEALYRVAKGLIEADFLPAVRCTSVPRVQPELCQILRRTRTAS